jgi:hypothetical protein
MSKDHAWSANKSCEKIHLPSFPQSLAEKLYSIDGCEAIQNKNPAQTEPGKNY